MSVCIFRERQTIGLTSMGNPYQQQAERWLAVILLMLCEKEVGYVNAEARLALKACQRLTRMV